MTLICSGSLAYDRLMVYGGVFADSFIANKLDIINLSFVTDKMNMAYGGCAGNIAYSLSLLGEKPQLVGCLGDDPDGADYLRHLENCGLPIDTVKVQTGYKTAGCTIATDQKNNQFTFFHPGAMMLPSGFDASVLPQPYDQNLAIISPGGFDEMKSLCADCRRLGLKFIFDPGQQLPAFSGQELREMLEGSSMLICNEYEFDLFKEKTGLTTENLFCHTETVVVTLGEKGCDLLVPSRGSQRISAVPVDRVGNPTGAGDAFRAGLLKGIGMGEHLVTCCRLGATVASFCVENEGGPQNHQFSLAQVVGRHAATFNEQLNLL